MQKRSNLVLDGRIIFDNSGVISFDDEDGFVFRLKGDDLLKISPSGLQFTGGQPVTIQATQVLSTEAVNLPLGQQTAENSVCVVVDELPLEVALIDPKEEWGSQSPIWYLVKNGIQITPYDNDIVWDTTDGEAVSRIATGLNFSWVIDGGNAFIGDFNLEWGSNGSSLPEDGPISLFFDQVLFCEIRTLRDIIGISDTWTIIQQNQTTLFQGSVQFSVPFLFEEFSISLPSVSSGAAPLTSGDTSQLSIGLSTRFDSTVAIV